MPEREDFGYQRSLRSEQADQGAPHQINRQRSLIGRTIDRFAGLARARKYSELNSTKDCAVRAAIYGSCEPIVEPQLTFFLCRHSDDMAALLASKG